MVTETQTSSSRRRFLRGLGAAGATVASAGLSGCVSVLLGGGNHQRVKVGLKKAQMPFASQQQRITKEMASHTANNRTQLIDAVQKPGATVWVPGDATIDMSGEPSTLIAPNVTIASNRGRNGGSGGLIKTDKYDNGLFVSDTGGCRISGLRLKGPRTDYFDPTRKQIDPYSALGFKLQGRRAIVDHCEVFGWTFAGIALGARSKTTQGWIHHNSMHHNQMNHLGYPMELYNGMHLIEWNIFDANRHSIAGFGREENGYEARFNLVGPNAIQHAFDMHNLGENMDSLSPRSGRGRVGGKFVNIHHNVFALTEHSAFSIQGYPKKYARFAQNWCAEPKGGSQIGDPEGVVYFPNSADVRVKKNSYGKQAVKQGQQWLQSKSQKVAASGSSNRSTATTSTSTSSPPTPKPKRSHSTPNSSTNTTGGRK